jgi:hypothetical protein
MNFLRRLSLALCAALFSLSIFLFATFVSIYYVFDSPKPIESALQQSGMYDSVVKNVVQKQSQRPENDINASSIPLNNEGVSAAIQSAIPPATVRANTEKAINSIYDWVHGKTKTPDFRIDLSEQRSTAIGSIGSIIRSRAEGLPVCTSVSATPQTTEELFSATCRPANVSVETLVAQVEKQAKEDLPIDTTFTANSLKYKDGQPLFDRLNKVPKYHHYYIFSLFILPALIILSAVGVIFASRTRRGGVRRISVTFITTGIYSLAIALLALWAINHFTKDIPSSSTADTQVIASKLVDVVKILATDLRKWWLGFGAGYVLLGIIGLLVVHFTKPRAGKLAAEAKATATAELGHNTDIPEAGTTFAPKPHMPASAEPETHVPHESSNKPS